MAFAEGGYGEELSEGIAGHGDFFRVVQRDKYSEITKQLLRRWLVLPYYSYCLRLAALYQLFINFTMMIDG